MTTLPTCQHRGKLIPGDRTWCRHPQVTGPHTKSVPVSCATCRACPFPTGGEPTATAPATTPLVMPSQLTGGPGTELVAIFKKLGAPGCQMCYELAARMDRLGKAGCKKQRRQIVDEIMPRAEQWAAQGKVMSLTPGLALRAGVSGCVWEAIRRA